MLIEDAVGELDIADIRELVNHDISEEFLSVRVGVVFDFLNVLKDSVLDFSVDVLEVLLSGDLESKNIVTDFGDAVLSVSVMLDFLLGSVGDAGVRHRVTLVSVSVEFEEDGASLKSVTLSEFGGFSDAEDIITLSLETSEASELGVDGAVEVGTVFRSSHAVMVVLDDIDDGEFPVSSHVGRFVDLTLVGRAVSVKSVADIRLVLVLQGEGDSRAEGNLGADDSVTSVEVVLPVVVVHGASLTLGGTSGSAHHFGDDSVGSVTSGQVSAVLSVSSDDAILLGNSSFHSNRYGFLYERNN